MTTLTCSYKGTAQLGRDSVQQLHYAYFFGCNARLGELQLSDSVNHTLWAMALVRSRTFGLTIGAEPVSMMAPFLDLANHSNSYSCSFRVSDNECDSPLPEQAMCDCAPQLPVRGIAWH